MKIGISNHAFIRLRQRFGIKATRNEFLDMLKKGKRVSDTCIKFGDMLFPIRRIYRGKGREYIVSTVLKGLYEKRL